MAEVYELSDKSRNDLLNARAPDYEALTKAMDTVCNQVVESGGLCDEGAFIAGFFGSPVLDYAGNEYKQLPQDFSDSLKKANEFQYMLGEPFIYGNEESVLINTIGLFVQNSGESYRSSVLSYRIRQSGGQFFGKIAANAYFQGRDSVGRPEEPSLDDISLININRYQGFDSFQRRSRTPIDNLIVGMPKIRKAIEADERLVTEGCWRFVDESYANLRAFAGAAVLSPDICVGAD